jgi:hypothetical protein
MALEWPPLGLGVWTMALMTPSNRMRRRSTGQSLDPGRKHQRLDRRASLDHRLTSAGVGARRSSASIARRHATAPRTAAAAASPMSTNQGGTFQSASARNATSPIPKSQGALMALVRRL